MLAVTHHLIVQLAYIRSNLSKIKVDWYSNYELLGDDIVIFDEEVANEYCRLMGDYGLEINLSKSVISLNGGFEFAKNTYYKGNNVSAVPFRMLISNNTRLGRVATALHFIKALSVKHPIAYLKRVLKVSKETKLDFNFNLVALLTMFLSSKKLSYTDFLKSLISLTPRAKHTTLERYLPTLSQTYLSNLFISLLRDKPFTFRDEDFCNHIFGLDSHFHRESLIDKLLSLKMKDVSFDTLQIDLSTQILRMLYDKSFPDVFDIQNHLVQVDETQGYLSRFTFNLVSQWFKGFTTFYLKLNGALLNRMTLDELVLLNEEMDSFLSLSKIVQRSIEKVEGSDKNLKVQEYNLKALQFVIKANPKRPLFTYSPLQVQEEFERIQFW
jgi:hypothetical protein